MKTASPMDKIETKPMSNSREIVKIKNRRKQKAKCKQTTVCIVAEKGWEVIQIRGIKRRA